MIDDLMPGPQASARHTEEGSRFNRTLFSAIDALEEGGISYALIGGVAASGLGRPRSTHDIDVFVRPEDAESALEALSQHGFETSRHDPRWLYKGVREKMLVDIIFKSQGDIYFDEEMNTRAALVSYHGRQVRVVAPEDLIIIKCAVHNENGPHHWHDALAILSHAQIDWDYLLKRARRAPRRLLALLIYAQSSDIWIPNQIIADLFRSIFNEGRPYSPGESHAKWHRQQELAPHQPAEYLAEKLKDAITQEESLGEQDVRLIIEGDHVLIKGQSASQSQRETIESVIRKAAPWLKVDNQVRVAVLPRPEGAETIQ